jgi:hypothetical protein
MRKVLSLLAGTLVLLAVPAAVAAHEVTDVDVDCDGESIHVSLKLFAEDGGREVTVTGPDGYLEVFFADQDVEWTVTLPLGPNGEYSIDWPDSGGWGPVAFTVDCAAASPTPTPTPTPDGEVAPTQGTNPTPTPDGEVAPTQGTDPSPTEAPGAVLPTTAGVTLPPTDVGPEAAPASSSAGFLVSLIALLGLVASGLWTCHRLATARVRSRR